MIIKTDYKEYNIIVNHQTIIKERIGDYTVETIFQNLAIDKSFITDTSLITLDTYSFRVDETINADGTYSARGVQNYILYDEVEPLAILKGQTLSSALNGMGIPTTVYGNDVLNFDYQMPRLTTPHEILDDVTAVAGWYWIWNKSKVEIIVTDKTGNVRIPTTYETVKSELHNKDYQRVLKDRRKEKFIDSHTLSVVRMPVNFQLGLLDNVEGKIKGTVVGIDTVLAYGGSSYQVLYVL